MNSCRDPGSNRGPSDLVPTELSRLVTNPTHEPVIVAQRRAGKETYDINAAGISQREQIASAEASVAQRGRHEGRFPEVRSLQTLMPNPRRSPART